MLRDNKTDRIIKSVGIAESSKTSGISETSRRLLIGDNKSIFEVIIDGYKYFETDIKNGDKFVYFKIAGYTLMLPSTLALLTVSQLGSNIKVVFDQLLESKNIDYLVKNGIIGEQKVKEFLKHINDLDINEKINIRKRDFKEMKK